MHGLIESSALLLLVCGAAALAATRAGLPPLLGYLAVGVILGPSVSGWGPQGLPLEFLSEIGVVLLLFLVGLEFSVTHFWNIKKQVFTSGLLQMLFAALPVVLVVGYCGIVDFQGAILLGLAVAVSSTALVAKLLSETGELMTRHGRASISILIFQDLATIPVLTLIAVWSRGGDYNWVGIVGEVCGILILFVLASLVARLLFHKLLTWVARKGNEENFVLISLAIVMSAAAGAHALGVSAALGAFLCGMVLGESDFKHHMEEHLIPFRHVFSGLFFVTIGLHLELPVLADSAGTVFLWLLALIPFKCLSNALALGASGLNRCDATRGALILGHGGEFSLLILSLSIQGGLLESATAQPLLGALVLSMAAAPLLIGYHQPLAALLTGVQKRESRESSADNEIAARSEGLEHHIVICGSGRLGVIISQLLRQADVPHLLIESDYDEYLRARDVGLPVFYGDASRMKTLESSGVSRARLVLITFSNEKPIERLVAAVRKRNPECQIIATCDNLEKAQALRRSLTIKVYAVETAAGLALAEQALLHSGVPPSVVDEKIRRMRHQLSPALTSNSTH